MPDYAVSTAFTAKDKGITDAYDRMARGADAYGDRAEKAFEKVSRGADHSSQALRNVTKHGYDFGAILKGIIAADLIRSGVGKVKDAVTGTVKEYLRFDDEMSQAVAKFSDLGPGVKDFQGHVNSLGKEVRKAGADSKFPLEQLAAGVNQIARSKIFDSTQTLEALVPLMHLNIDAQGDFAESTKNIMGMVGAWALKTDSAKDTMRNYKDMVNLVAVANNNALVSVTDLAETMETVGPNARAMGYGLKEVTAMTTFLARAGIKGTMASTALRNIFMHFARPDFKTDMAALGMPLTKGGDFRPLREIFLDVNKFVKGLEPHKAKSFLDVLFGMRGSAGGNDIMRQLDEYTKLEEEMNNSAGKMDAMAERLNDTKVNRLHRIVNRLTDKSWDIIDSFSEKFSDGIDKMLGAIARFDVQPIIDGLKATGMILGFAYDMLKPFIPALPWIAAAWITWNGALKVFAALKVVETIWLIGSALVAGLGPVGAMSTALYGLGGALLSVSTPLLAIAALVAPGAALYSLVTGKDNFISKIAQNLGIVPELATNDKGVITGYAPKVPAAGPRVTSAQEQERMYRYAATTGDFSGLEIPTPRVDMPPVNVQPKVVIPGGDARSDRAPRDAYPAPNAKTAGLGTGKYDLTIHNAPQGSTFTGTSYGAPPIEAYLLGAN